MSAKLFITFLFTNRVSRQKLLSNELFYVSVKAKVKYFCQFFYKCLQMNLETCSRSKLYHLLAEVFSQYFVLAQKADFQFKPRFSLQLELTEIQFYLQKRTKEFHSTPHTRTSQKIPRSCTDSIEINRPGNNIRKALVR